MGCFWSNESSRELEAERWLASSAPDRFNRARLQACYGEYKCQCGRQWSSRLSWPNKFQICRRCKLRVYPRSQRPLLPSDMREGKENVKEHESDLCQMCQELGHYCGKAKGKRSNIRKRY